MLFNTSRNKIFLYREKHSTFEEYCKQKWQIKRQRAYELMDAASIVNTLSEISDKPNDEIKASPTINIRESHADALEKVPEEMRNLSDITITISGKFIVENNLVPIWRKLRGFSEEVKIDNFFEDVVSIHQASVLGLFPS
jgi:hypothetical protein